MKINWKVRIKNPAFWVQIVVSVFAPILTYFGLRWSDMTTWAAIGSVLWQAIQNPVVVVSALVGVYNTCIDPTTKGIGDSVRALGYDKPAE
jgi:phi LC3 family holin